MTTYKLIWDDFCSWYLEVIKPSYQKPIDKETYETTIAFYEKLMKVLHPFAPFITEEIWHLLGEHKQGDDIIIAEMPVSGTYDEKMIMAFERAEKIISGIRTIRREKNIPQKESLQLMVKEGEGSKCIFYPIVQKMGNIEGVEIVTEKPDGSLSFIVGSQEFYIPLSDSIDVDAEIAKLEEEQKYTRGFLISVEKKLSNERFVNNAPAAVVEKEKQKMADAEARLKVIEEQLVGFKK